MWYLIPGMGADARMFGGPWSKLPDSQALNWPACSGRESLRDIAKRLIANHAIRAGDSVVGTSLGGMVACEIAAEIPLRHLVLIGSAVHPSEISSFLKALAPLAPAVPFGAIKISSGSVPLDLAKMFSKAEVAFVRNAIPAIFEWEGLKPTPARLTRIHGSGDLVIPCPKAVDFKIDGGHLLPMTHAEACVKVIKNLRTEE